MKEFYIKPETVQLLKEKKEGTLHGIYLGNVFFFNLTPRPKQKSKNVQIRLY
jgi:hypothetical protein